MCRSDLFRSYGFLFISMGSMLAMLALFLHPMSPEHFLALAFSRPSETFLRAEGMRAAMLFWIGLLAAALGLVCLLPVSAMKHRRRPSASSYRDVNREEAERGWSFM